MLAKGEKLNWKVGQLLSKMYQKDLANYWLQLPKEEERKENDMLLPSEVVEELCSKFFQNFKEKCLKCFPNMFIK